MRRFTGKELAREDCCLQDGEEEHEEQYDNLQAQDAWNGASKGHDRDL